MVYCLKRLCAFLFITLTRRRFQKPLQHGEITVLESHLLVAVEQPQLYGFEGTRYSIAIYFPPSAIGFSPFILASRYILPLLFLQAVQTCTR